jgi:hydroxymethylbilane synthase
MGSTEKKRNNIVIGTRGSKLALWQAEWIAGELTRRDRAVKVVLKKIKTTGDKILDVPLAKVGGKGLFVKEIEEALLRKEVDLAVHSMKDVPTDFPESLHLTAICEREDPRDAFIAPMKEGAFSIRGFKDLPTGATVGTSSLRRACQLLHQRPDLVIVPLRGNLDTRLRKLDEGQFSAIILAAAGVKRLGWQKRITEILDMGTSLPAIGQGAIGIECRTDDEYINGLVAALNHPETSVCVRAERAFLKRLEGGCQVPIAAHARLIERATGNPAARLSPESLLALDGLVGGTSGDRLIRASLSGDPSQAESLGVELANHVLSQGAAEILKEVYGETYGKSVPPIDRSIGS